MPVLLCIKKDSVVRAKLVLFVCHLFIGWLVSPTCEQEMCQITVGWSYGSAMTAEMWVDGNHYRRAACSSDLTCSASVYDSREFHVFSSCVTLYDGSFVQVSGMVEEVKYIKDISIEPFPTYVRHTA